MIKCVEVPAIEVFSQENISCAIKNNKVATASVRNVVKYGQKAHDEMKHARIFKKLRPENPGAEEIFETLNKSSGAARSSKRLLETANVDMVRQKARQILIAYDLTQDTCSDYPC